MKKIECVIMDWAGTAVDYGCFAPVSAFIESFNAIGISITAEEARRPMGLTKIDHIRALFQMERIGEAFYQKYGRKYNETDVQGRYAEFQRLLFNVCFVWKVRRVHIGTSRKQLFRQQTGCYNNRVQSLHLSSCRTSY